MNWQQGQHVCIVGSNGSGKSYLTAKMLEYRKWVIVLKTKADDIQYRGFKRIRSIDGITANQQRYVLDPPYEKQREEIHRAFEYIWKTRAWCVNVDELYYLCDTLKLESDINRLLTQGRSLGISCVCGIQRPTRVTRFAMSEAIHVFSFRLEGRDVKTVSEATTPRIEPAIASLKRYQFAYFNRLDGSIEVAKAQQLERL